MTAINYIKSDQESLRLTIIQPMITCNRLFGQELNIGKQLFHKQKCNKWELLDIPAISWFRLYENKVNFHYFIRQDGVN